MEPQRRVFLPGDIEIWEKSQAYYEIMGFLRTLNEKVKGKKLSVEATQSDILKNISRLIDTLNLWIKEFPPQEQPQRYGNKAFSDFYNKLKENAAEKLKECLSADHHSNIAEIAPYLTESFGHSKRIDYGTGHELAFIMFLCCLHKIGALQPEDCLATVTVLFKKYIELCRKLQITYKMEPAGSQGVWSLDDYQFIPFIWGSSQLVMHPRIVPNMLADETIVRENSKEYLFFGCIEYILQVKNGPFAEHSNQLWNISAVPTWSKVNQGLFKMYKAEILNKFPLFQHVLFGSLLSIDPVPNQEFRPPSNAPISTANCKS